MLGRAARENHRSLRRWGGVDPLDDDRSTRKDRFGVTFGGVGGKQREFYAASCYRVV
jgi:hypothetical protein